MISYIQKKSINYSMLKDILKKTEETNQFTNMGFAKRDLELELEKILDIAPDKCVVCTSNGTLALHAIYLYLEHKNIKWVSPSFTFPSCCVGGFDCEIVDIDDTYSIELSEENVSKYDGFIITNLFGTYPENIFDWIKVCKNRGKTLVFDNASSPLTSINGVNFCNLGDFSFGSLHHTKSLGFGEGGFIVCDKELYMDMNRLLGFGFKIEDGARVFSKRSSNYKMSDIAAAGILQHIKRYNVRRHIEIQKKLVEEVQKIEGVSIFNYKEGVFLGNLPLLFCEKVEKDFFVNQGVEAQKYYKPIENHKNSMSLYDRIINFPLHSELSDNEINLMLGALRAYLKNGVKK